MLDWTSRGIFEHERQDCDHDRYCTYGSVTGFPLSKIPRICCSLRFDDLFAGSAFVAATGKSCLRLVMILRFNGVTDDDTKP